MSDPVNPAAAQNTNQAAPEPTKPAGQDPVAQPKADPAPAAAAPAPASSPASEPPKVDPAPVEIKYELKNADGSLVDAAASEKIVSFAKEHKLSPEQAQAIYNRENANQAEQEKQYNERKAQWVESLKADPEFGGSENFEKNSQMAHKVFIKFASPEFAKTLEETGLGNYPGFVKTFHKIALALEGDKFVSAPIGTSERKPTEKIMYDKTK